MQLPASLFLQPWLHSIGRRNINMARGEKFLSLRTCRSHFMLYRQYVAASSLLNSLQEQPSHYRYTVARLVMHSEKLMQSKQKKDKDPQKEALSLRTLFKISAFADDCCVLEEDKGCQNKERNEDADRPDHVAEEAGHGNAAFLSNGAHHEVGGIAYIAVCAHKHGTG